MDDGDAASAGQLAALLPGGLARVDATQAAGEVKAYWQAGLKVLLLIPGGCDGASAGGYNGGGVAAVDPAGWASCAVNVYQTECAGSASNCPAVEVLNEPAGPWFWGGDAGSQRNASAYAELVKQTWSAFHDKFGTGAPKILASYDGGSDSNVNWGQAWWTPGIAQYVDGVTVHPYGGTGDRNQSAAGNRGDVTAAFQQTGRPVWITELGWPTGSPNGDSLQWDDGSQAANVASFVAWVNQQPVGEVAGVTFYSWPGGAYGLGDAAMGAVASGNHTATLPAPVASQVLTASPSVVLTAPPGEQTASVAGGTVSLKLNEWNGTDPVSLMSDGGSDFKVASSGQSVAAGGAPEGYYELVKGCSWGDCTSGPFPISVSSIGAGMVTTSVTCSTSGVSGSWDNSYDIWFNSDPSAGRSNDSAGSHLEMMVWLNHTGDVEPIPPKVASNVTIGGQSYDVWHGGDNTVSYVLDRPSGSYTADLYPLIQDAIGRGYLQSSWSLLDVEMGFEVWNGGAGLGCSKFAVDTAGYASPGGA